MQCPNCKCRISLDSIYRSSLFFGSGKCMNCTTKIRISHLPLFRVIIYSVAMAILYLGMEYLSKHEYGPIFPAILPMIGAYLWLGIASFLLGRVELDEN